MKKQIGKISAIILMFQIILQISVPVISEGIAGTSDSRFEYTVNSDKISITITKYVGKDTKVVIPNNIDGYNVTSIGTKTFDGCNKITKINIPEGVNSIGVCAFKYCSSLISINIPESVTSIANYAFEGCSSLTSIKIPEGITSIGTSVFDFCRKLTSINIPKNVTSIGDYAFRECNSLTNIEIPEEVTSIGNYAFYRCSSLTSIEIPEGLTNIGSSAFYGCDKISSIKIPSNIISIGSLAFPTNVAISIEVNSKVQANTNYQILNKDGEIVKENTIIGTGMKMKISSGGKYDILVKGDLNGDGKISTTDITKMKKHIIQKELLQGCYEKAGNVNSDTKISVTDLAKMKKALVGLATL